MRALPSDRHYVTRTPGTARAREIEGAAKYGGLAVKAAYCRRSRSLASPHPSESRGFIRTAPPLLHERQASKLSQIPSYCFYLP